MKPPIQYEIEYISENTYEGMPQEAHLQFLIIPETNATQKILRSFIENNLGAEPQFSINGLGFPTVRFHLKQVKKQLKVNARFKVEKAAVNPFDFDPDLEDDRKVLQEMAFRTTHAPYLNQNKYTAIPKKHSRLFPFKSNLSLLENLKELNIWCHQFLKYQSDVTSTDTTVSELLENPVGVCQDYAHLFCAFARNNGIPTRYISGYLNQGAGLEGDAQMHAWVEALLPGVGWLEFDPTNNLLANEHYIKVCHGKNYLDCAPLKGVVYGTGSNKTDHSVQVSSQQ